MSDEVRMHIEELRGLGASFETSADDLGRRLTAFRRWTDAEALSAAFGSAEAARPYRELYEEAERALVLLRERLAEVGDGIKETAARTQAADDELAETIRRVR
ncbi:hypothetical protein [Streptomyces sp. NPDC003077]|uniref:hypothetical protein n=1 Tax=Streptomyces sp. NPDC003077 TaxID=3154443 RepID=UPI0033B95F1A